MFDKNAIDKLMETLSDILSEKYGCKVTMRAIPKDSEEGREILRKRKEEEEAIRRAEGAIAG